MIKYSFQNDYSEGAHHHILQALSSTNTSQQSGYGEDQFSMEAADLIRQAINNPIADIHFVCGGTQANLLVLSSILRPYESVIAVESGHISIHEAGAIEATGHKVHTIKGHHGKVTIPEIELLVREHHFEHMVKPRAVYISQATEVGTIYSADELRTLSDVCKKMNLLLYVDGARLGSALTAKTADLSLSELSALVDVFYIGGTKNGALIGEAIVINNPALKDNFRYMMKQKGALLSKGRLLGIQFLELFHDNLFYELASHANLMAEQLSDGISRLGYTFQTNSYTNQIFPILPRHVIENLIQEYGFYVWGEAGDNHSTVRLVTSWATTQQAVDSFLLALENLSS